MTVLLLAIDVFTLKVSYIILLFSVSFHIGNMDKIILETLSNKGELNTYDLAQELSADHQVIVGATKSLQSLGEVRLLRILNYLLNGTNYNKI